MHSSAHAPIGPVFLWTLVLTGPIAWILRLLMSYAGIAVGCAEGLEGARFLGLTALGHFVLWLSTAMALACLTAAVLSWRAWRRSRAMGGGDELLLDRRRTMTALALFLNAFFLATILAETGAVFVLDPCL